ncbi:MAG: restriction endonuclease subunit R [Candidatus Omnitrophica bacterium]|nr:restriction endonuclease subunit R [Candidatus Omnitrophota bacterium]
MREKLLPLITQLKSDKKLVSYDEASTKQAVILRILSLLGWDTFNIDEVNPEYSVAGKRVDFSLRYSNVNKAFIEVKKISEDLEKHQEQLLNYSFQEGVKLSILTNGITWWFYLPLHEGSWEQRKFYTIEIYDQNAEEIVDRFIDYLAKENIISGKAITNAEAIYKSRQKNYLIKETLPKAWSKLISEPNELLIDLLAEATEKLCGFKPDHSAVENFISANFSKIESPYRPEAEKKADRLKIVSTEINGSYSGRSVTAFNFQETRYEVRFWKDMLMGICNIMSSMHRNNFERVLTLQGTKKPYFTKNANELRLPEKIKNTNIFVETNLSANGIVKMCLDVLSLFGYTKDDLAIEAH